MFSSGAAANFISLSGLFLLLFAFIIGSVVTPDKDGGTMHPIASVLLTLAVLAGTIFFVWEATANLGKAGIIITAGAALASSAVCKIIYELNKN